MKLHLENKNQPVKSNSEFFFRMLRFSLFAFILIVLSLGIGMIGYHHVADISWIDSFHMACLILTGMGPVVEMKTNAAKLFSSFYALFSGVAFLSISAVFFSPIIHRVLHILNVDMTD
jgi:hypothetical protein